MRATRPVPTLRTGLHPDTQGGSSISDTWSHTNSASLGLNMARIAEREGWVTNVPYWPVGRPPPGQVRAVRPPTDHTGGETGHSHSLSIPMQKLPDIPRPCH
ncbi:hypothetical protein LSAT2_024397 [Lamellibrachia satsuma]|nr:hypothetical protein LSAT2_024397 [Lamellibrachia satsuma]